MSKISKMKKIKQLVAGVENQYSVDRSKTFEFLGELKDVCASFEYIDEKVSVLEDVLLDFRIDHDALYSASGAVISAMQMYDENHPSWNSWA